MMKKSLMTLASVALGGMLLSQSAAAGVVAVWDSQQALIKTNYAKAKLANLQSSLAGRQQQLKTYQSTIERLQQQYASQQASMTEAQKQELRRQIETNIASYETIEAQVTKTLIDNRKEMMRQIAPKMKGIIESIVKQKNIDVLIDSSDGVVTYAKPELDVTADFTQRINEQVPAK